MSDASKEKKAPPLPVQEAEWGEQPENQYGYASEAERLNKRGLEDWEMVENISESQHNIPYWFIAIFVALLLVAVGLNFPFWGDRPGYEREWFNWGLPLALVYTGIAVVVIYWLVDYRHIRSAKKAERGNNSKTQQQD